VVGSAPDIDQRSFWISAYRNSQGNLFCGRTALAVTAGGQYFPARSCAFRGDTVFRCFNFNHLGYSRFFFCLQSTFELGRGELKVRRGFRSWLVLARANTRDVIVSMRPIPVKEPTSPGTHYASPLATAAKARNTGALIEMSKITLHGCPSAPFAMQRPKSVFSCEACPSEGTFAGRRAIISISRRGRAGRAPTDETPSRSMAFGVPSSTLGPFGFARRL